MVTNSNFLLRQTIDKLTQDIKFFLIRNNTVLSNCRLKITGTALAHLFVKVLRPGSEKTVSVFESSCHLLLPVRDNPIKRLDQGHNK